MTQENDSIARWKQELKDGKLTQEEFDSLMRSQKSLDEMDKLANEGVEE